MNHRKLFIKTYYSMRNYINYSKTKLKRKQHKREKYK